MRRVLIPGLLLALGALAGCGGSSSASSAASSVASSASSSISSAASSAASSVSSSASSGVSSAASSVSSAVGGALTLAADPSGALKYNTTSLTASSGKVTIAFANSSPVMHNVTVASSNGSVVGATPTFNGGVKTLTLNLKPGTYTFYCSVPGHRQAGMQGTLVVK